MNLGALLMKIRPSIIVDCSRSPLRVGVFCVAKGPWEVLLKLAWEIGLGARVVGVILNRRSGQTNPVRTRRLTLQAPAKRRTGRQAAVLHHVDWGSANLRDARLRFKVPGLDMPHLHGAA